MWQRILAPFRSRPPASSDAAWLSPWLDWLERLERAMGRTSFPEDPDLEGLHALWKAGATVRDAERWIEEGARRGDQHR